MPWKHETIEKWLCWYITVRNYCGAGRGHIEWLINAGKMGGYVLMYLVFLGYTAEDFSKGFIFFLGIGFLVFTFVLGFLWNRFKGYEVEAKWGNKRNPLLVKLEEKLNK